MRQGAGPVGALRGFPSISHGAGVQAGLEESIKSPGRAGEGRARETQWVALRGQQEPQRATGPSPWTGPGSGCRVPSRVPSHSGVPWAHGTLLLAHVLYLVGVVHLCLVCQPSA